MGEMSPYVFSMVACNRIFTAVLASATKKSITLRNKLRSVSSRMPSYQLIRLTDTYRNFFSYVNCFDHGTDDSTPGLHLLRNVMR